MTTTLQNSIWPNDDGNLGNIKVQIPDGVNVKWPEGDALLGNCVYQNGKLVGFVDTKALTVNSSGSTTINYDYVNIELPFAEDAMTINRGPRNKYLFIKFNNKEVEEGIVYVRFEELSDETKALLRSATTIRDNVLYDENDNVIGEFNTNALLTCHNLLIDENGNFVVDESTEMPKTTDGKSIDALFMGMDIFTGQLKDIKIVTFDSDLSSLTNGELMFMFCPNLTSFNGDLSSLTNGDTMFGECPNLTSFTSNLSNLKYGNSMFSGCPFTSFASDLPNLTEGNSMFAWCENLTSFSADLPKLTNGTYMFQNCHNLTSFTSALSSLTDGERMFWQCYNLPSFNSDLSSLTNGTYMFSDCHNLSSFTSDLPKLTNGTSMFSGCTKLTLFSTDLPNLTDSGWMFSNCENLTSFNSDLSSLTNGEYMFGYCSNLTSFTSDLPKLTNGDSMFRLCENLTSFNSDLSSLTNGNNMFYYCTALNSFTSNLSNLTYGGRMFHCCLKLTSFTSNLSSLTNGHEMFSACKLDTASVQNIADTIKDVTSLTNGSSTFDEVYKAIDIGIGNSEPNEQEAVAFNTMVSKGWTVYVDVNGGSSSEWNPASLTPIDGEEQQTLIPFYAKSIQSDEKHANYVDENGNFYNILGGNYIYGDDISTYGMFTCEADAAANMRLTKIEKSQRFALKP